jgi:type IX secretion system PorP/SprF family membrane protein
MKRFLLIISLTASFAYNGYCQASLFKMYDYSPQKLNPAYAAIDEYLEVDYIYRKQQTGSPYSFISQNLELKYPILNKYRLWSGVAFGVFNDQLEASDRYNQSQFRVSYAINLPANKYNNITFGLLASYNLQQFNSSGLSTGSQFVEYMGFDAGIPSGEIISNLGTSSYWGISSGLIWQKLSRTKSVAQEIGISLQHLNKPNIDWEYQNGSVQILPTLFIHGNIAVYETFYLKVITEAVAAIRTNESSLLAGARYQYYPKTTATTSTHYDLTTRLSTNKELSVGFKMIKK